MSNEFIPYSSQEASEGRAHAHKRYPNISLRIDVLVRFANETQKLMKADQPIGFIEASRSVMGRQGSLPERQAYASAIGHMMNQRKRGIRDMRVQYGRRAQG